MDIRLRSRGIFPKVGTVRLFGSKRTLYTVYPRSSMIVSESGFPLT